ncbi:NAD(P)/FAD-dependent oxidoreductase [Paraflavitalea soli]|uniref:NAD(P)/FAD-dependent oxidoreductase n=1 Tax=Paraflavitalea soli TaxID=2315862 RepID=A0A3B7MST7_9BACT|nr:NAD(P)/FAD-dependent oxidoreductase [Paraflavitalea soli]AXY76319.1 NAD(P)/FAD-dependent oxidoreductase [Paraflavitalea soli]
METTSTIPKGLFDVIIVGGSYAGLAAAMTLGRSLRRVLIVDSGLPCNRQTPHSHNFITQDGEKPGAIAQLALKQVLAYPTVQFIQGKVTEAQRNGDHFTIKAASGEQYTASKLLFATGIADIMPNLPGFAACWGISVLHCPYCHGYEVKGNKLAVLANGEMAFEYVRLLHQWSQNLVLLTNGSSTLGAALTDKLQQHNIPIIETPLQELVHNDGYITAIRLADGSVLEVDAMFHKPAFRQHCDIPEALGCTRTEQGFLQADEFGKTNVPGVYVAGDNSSMMRSVAAAAAAGNKAGAWINKELVEERF